jgi:hypothetical protein
MWLPPAAAGLIRGKVFAVDASLIEADANKGRSDPGAEWNKNIDLRSNQLRVCAGFGQSRHIPACKLMIRGQSR